MGLDVVCDARLAFVNCTHQMLLQEFFLLPPADKVVVEIQARDPRTRLLPYADPQSSVGTVRPAYGATRGEVLPCWAEGEDAKTLGLSLPFVDRSHSESVTWAHQMTSGAAR